MSQILEMSDFNKVKLLHEYLLSKTTAKEISLGLRQAEDASEDFILRFGIPKVRKRFFEEVIVQEAKKYFEGIESGDALPDVADKDWGEGILDIRMSAFRVGELFCVCSLQKIHEALGREVADKFVGFFDYEKMIQLINVYEKK